jgi:hypothetical protein
MKTRLTIAVVAALCLWALGRPYSSAADKKPVKIAILSVTTHRIVSSGEGLGALDTASESLSKEQLDTYAGIHFDALNDAAIKQFGAKFGELGGVEVLPVATLAASDAFKAFKAKMDTSNARYKFLPGTFISTQDLPPVHATLWQNKMTSDDQKAYMAEVGAAAKEFCEKAGVDAVWMVQTYPGYRTKGLSKLFSKATMGSGKGIATMTFTYVLLNKNGEKLAADSNLKDGISDGKIWMKAGRTDMDAKMEGFLNEAIINGAKKVVTDVKGSLPQS